MLNNGSDTSIHFIRTTAVDPDPRVTRFAGWIADMADEITVLAWDREGRSLPREHRGRLDIRRSSFAGGHGRGLRNIFGFAAFNATVLWRLLTKTPSVIHACDLDTVLPAIIVSKLKKVPVVYDIFDFYADSRKVGGLRTLIRLLDYWAMRQVDRIIIAHESRLVQMGKGAERLKGKISVIYNTPDDISLDEPAGTDPIPYFSYVGTLQPDRGLPAIMAAAVQTGGAKLVVGGFGPLDATVAAAAASSSAVEFLGPLDHRQAMACQGRSLAIIALYDPAFANNRFAAPNKMYEAMCLGRPVITSSGTLFADFVRDHGTGFVVPYGDVGKLREVMAYCLENSAELAQMGARARRIYERQFSGEAMKKILRDVYNNLLEDKRPCAAGGELFSR